MTILTKDIAFDAGEKAGVVLLDLSAAYDTVWLRGLQSQAATDDPRPPYGQIHHGDAV